MAAVQEERRGRRGFRGTDPPVARHLPARLLQEGPAAAGTHPRRAPGAANSGLGARRPAADLLLEQCAGAPDVLQQRDVRGIGAPVADAPDVLLEQCGVVGQSVPVAGRATLVTKLWTGRSGHRAPVAAVQPCCLGWKLRRGGTGCTTPVAAGASVSRPVGTSSTLGAARAGPGTYGLDDIS
ncbi:g7291 [Coccomyxa elongata]